MRFLHTADWHLGRLFHGVHLTRDQEHLLDQFVDLVAETKPGLVILAGDLYDRAVPPPDAVALLDETLSRIVQGHKTPVVGIAGNHDSPERVGFASRLLSDAGLFLSGNLRADPAHHVFRDEHGPLHVYAIPYAEPARVREVLEEPELHNHDSSMKALADRIWEMHPSGERAVLTAHAFVAGGEESESERPLSVGGAGTISPSVFQGFDYTALGHLHAPQNVKGGRVCYSGSLMKYSFSEAGHEKGVSLVEIDKEGNCTSEKFALTPRRDVRMIEGEFDQLLQSPPGGNREDYLLVRLTDNRLHLDALGRLREVYPNVLQIERPWMDSDNLDSRVYAQRKGLSERDLFEDFYKETTGQEPDQRQIEFFVQVAEDLRMAQREE